MQLVVECSYVGGINSATHLGGSRTSAVLLTFLALIVFILRRDKSLKQAKTFPLPTVLHHCMLSNAVKQGVRASTHTHTSVYQNH